MGGVEAPGRQKTVPVLIDHEGGQIIVMPPYLRQY